MSERIALWKNDKGEEMTTPAGQYEDGEPWVAMPKPLGSWTLLGYFEDDPRAAVQRAELEALRKENERLRERLEELPKTIFDRIDDAIQRVPHDGMTAIGTYSDDLKLCQDQFIAGMRLARVSAMCAARAALQGETE